SLYQTGRRFLARGLNGNTVRRANGKSAAAPATVIGECLVGMPLGNREGGQTRRPESQETGRHDRMSSYDPGGVVKEMSRERTIPFRFHIVRRTAVGGP